MRATLTSMMMASSYSSKCYYASLNVPKNASLDDIKKEFRKMSKQYHPDVAKKGCPVSNADRFKEISNAYQTLSNAKERRRYDLERQDQHWYRNRGDGNTYGGGGGFGSFYSAPYANSNMPPPPKGPKATGVYAVVETMFKPRNFIIGIAFGIGASVVYQYFGGTASSNSQQRQQQRMMMKQNQGQELVEAWKNPKTGRWEQAAPWDPVYQRLKPTLEMVPREQVRARTR